MTDDNNKYDTADYAVDFDNVDGLSTGLEKDASEDTKIEKTPLDVKATSKDTIRATQDLMMAVIKKEIEEQAKLGVYDVKLFNIVKDIAKNNEVGFDDLATGRMLDGMSKIRAASKKQTKDRKEEAVKYRIQ